MNLTKYFNFNYLKENIKKSKGIITLLLIAVPVFTILSLVFIFNKANYTTVITELEISIPNIIGMYIIPYVLSVALFGYIYKKSSVDFINSMPINRKAIFITNTIGGIILITLIQLITLIVSLVCNALVSTIIIFPQMLIDIFITMWIAYFFMFCATNLAMSLSGTVLTQLVLTMIIIFIVPFCMTTFDSIIYNQNMEDQTYSYKEEIFRIYEGNEEYTLPFNITYNMENLYSDVSNTKMFVLGILYLGIGLYCFQKRKMENAEESFGSNKVHLLVKALTIFPMIIILNLLKLDTGFNIFVLALITVYYFVYDFFVKRKIKFLISVVSLIITLVASQMIVLGLQSIKIEDKNIEREDIDKIAINWNFENSFRYDIKQDKNLFIDNSQIIDIIYNSAKGVKELEASYNNVNEEVIEPLTYIYIDIIMKDGNQYKTNTSIKEEDLYKVIDILEEDSNYVDKIKADYLLDGIFLKDQCVITKNSREINDILKEVVNKMTLREIYDMNYSNETIEKEYYKNHQIKTKSIPLDINKDILQLIADEQNEIFNKNWKNVKTPSIYINDGSLGYNSEEYEDFGGYFSYTIYNMQKFLDENINEKFDSTQKGYLIKVYSPENDMYLYFFTNKTDKIDEIIKLEDEYMKRDDIESGYYEQQYYDIPTSVVNIK